MRLLLDCGPGSLAELRRHCELDFLDAVFISHAHPDHCLDLVSLRQSLVHAPVSPRLPSADRLLVLASQETIGVLKALGACFCSEGEADFWEPVIEFRTIEAGDSVELGRLGLRVIATKHYRACLAVRIESSGRSLVYGADGGPQASLQHFARGAQLLMLESSLSQREDNEAVWGHLAPEEAGRIARDAGAERLLLTHYFEETGTQGLLERARASFGPAVELARQGAQHEV
jgi:ribonuclease BN (tRNA processing enzyme)